MKIRKNIFVFLSILVLAGGIFIRFWHLDVIPPGVHYDEAFNGIDALKSLESGNFRFFYPENYGREGLHINVIAFFIKIFGNTNFGLRFANALWGSLTLLGFYFLLREFKFSSLSVLAGTFMLAFSFWHLVFSRTAYRAIMVPLILVWMFYFFWKAVNNPKKKAIWILLAGIFLGLGFHTYISFRIAPLVFALVAVSFLLGKEKLWKNYKKYLAFSILGVVLVSLPIILYYSGHFKDFISRSEAVSIFNAPKGMGVGEALGKSVVSHLSAFFVFGDKNPRHNYNNQPLLPAAWAVLFFIGSVISLGEIAKTLSKFIKYKRKINPDFAASPWFHISVLGQSIFWLMLVPGFLSIEGIPHSLRIIGAIPGVFILSVLPLEYIIGHYGESKKTGGKFPSSNNFLVIFASLLFFMIIGGVTQVYTYFFEWPKNLSVLGAYERKLYDFGMLVKELPVGKNNYITVAYNTWIKDTKKESSMKTTEYIAWPKTKDYEFVRPLEGKDSIICDGTQVVFLESDQWLRDQYKNRCPNLSQQKYTYDNGKYVFWVMKSK